MILVAGESLIDLFIDDAERAGALDARAVPGGSPFNVAIGLARLGAPAAFLGGLSTDRFGRLLKARLAREGVDTGHVIETDRPTTLSVVAKDEAGSPRYTFHGEGCADRAPRPQDLPAALAAGVEALVFGSYSIAVEPFADAVAALAARESARRVVSLDPNVRFSIVPDREAWHRRFDHLLGHAAIVKASREDIATAWGGAEEAQMAARWLARGVMLVVVTRGEAGAIAFTRSGTVEVPGRAVAVQDTVGAGDTFHAALLAHLRVQGLLNHKGLSGVDPLVLRQGLGYAVAASAITCTRQGADLPTAREVAAFAEDIA